MIEQRGLVQLALSAGLSAALYHAEGNLEQAETEYRRALQLWSGNGSEFVARQLEVLNNLALLYVEEGRLDQAHQILNQARTVLDSFPPSDRLSEVILLNNLGKLLYTERNYSAAEACLHRAVAIAEELSNLPPNTLENLCSNWAVLLRKVGRKNEAKVQQARAASHRNAIAAAGNSGVVDISQLANSRNRSAKE